MNSVLFNFGFLQIKWYSFLILIAMLIAFLIISKESKRKGINDDNLLNLLFYGILIGILGARIYYVIFNLDYYLSTPLEIFMVWNGGLAIHGGIIAALIFLFLYSKKKNLNFLLMLDIIVVGVILAQSIGRWGNFFNQEAYGRNVTLEFLKNMHLPKFIINGMYIDGSYREPTFLYESILSLIGFISLITIRKISKIRVGQLSGIYFMWYGLERIFIESFRADSLMLGKIKVAQLVSLIAILCGLYLIIKKSKNNTLYKEEKVRRTYE